MTTLEGRLIEVCEFNPGSICKSPFVSPDSKNIAYPIKSQKWFSQGMKICINGSIQKHYQTVSGIIFSPDSQHIAYLGERKNRWVVVLDGNEASQEYDEITITTPIFSPDSKHIAFGAKRGNKWFAVKDGIEEEQHDGFVKGTMTFSSNSKLSYAFYIGPTIGRRQLGGKIIVINDRNKVAEYDKSMNEGMSEKSLEFSPNSKILVYGARRNNKSFVVIDGNEESPHDHISEDISFSPDSKRLAYCAIDGSTWSLILDGKRYGKYSGISWFLFSPDSKHFAYAAHAGEDHYTVLNGEEKRKYPGILDSFVGFSRDSKHFAYGAERRSQQFAVLDDTEQKEYLGITQIDLSFSPDSEYLAYAALQNNQNMLIVVNNAELDMNINLVNKSNFIFDTPKKFHTLVTFRNKFYRLDVEIKE